MHIIQTILETFTHERIFKLQLFLLENHHFIEEAQRKCGRKIQTSGLYSKKKNCMIFHFILSRT